MYQVRRLSVASGGPGCIIILDALYQVSVRSVASLLLHYYFMLCIVESVRHLPKRIAQFLVKLAKHKQLNCAAHLKTVNAKRVRIKNAKVPPTDYKALARKRGRQVSRYKQQNDVLRLKVLICFECMFFLQYVNSLCSMQVKHQKALVKQNKVLKDENIELRDKVAFLQQQLDEVRETVKQLRAGVYDMTLNGGSQEDMTRLLHQCNGLPQLAAEIKKQDTTGTLDLFWKEQLERQNNVNKRKHWNPIVLRCAVICVSESSCANYLMPKTCLCVCVLQIHAPPVGDHG